MALNGSELTITPVCLAQHLRWFVKGWTSFHQKNAYLAQKKLEAAVYQKRNPYLARKKKGG